MTTDRRLWAWTLALAGGAGVLAAYLGTQRQWSVDGTVWGLLPLFVLLVVAAEQLRIRVRVGHEVDAVNLVEAVLAPALFAFAGPLVVAVMASGLLISGAIRRSSPVKLVFNVAQWSLAAGTGALVFEADPSGGLHVATVARLVGALAAAAMVNDLAVLIVLAIARGRSPWSVAAGMRRVIVFAWGGGWVLNVLIGLLYVVAYVGHPAASLLFAVPLVVLHVAYRGFAVARADQQRLATLHEAAQLLAGADNPRDGISEFLAAVAACYRARSAILVVRGATEREVHAWDGRRSPAYEMTTQDNDAPTLVGALAGLPGPLYIQPRDRHQLGGMLRQHGWRDCLSAPMLDEGRQAGCLAVFDQQGVEGSAAGQLAILETLTRETASTFAKGRLFAEAVEQRRRLEEVISAMSDGMFTVGRDGTVLSWNRAFEDMTGIAATDAVGRGDCLMRLQPEALDGTPVDLSRWTDDEGLPTELRIRAVGGGVHRLECSYSHLDDEDGQPRVLVAVARDVTTHEEMAALREEYLRLTEEQAASRDVVEQLQQAVVPPPPAIGGVQLAVEYIPSDTNAPTGGDLYDWQLLPDGDVHLAVVDVLGHGVAATKDALSVVHTLRVVASEGVALEEIIGRADALLGAQAPDLVATAVVARYTPSTGALRVVSGGHPPALVLHPDGRITQVTASGGAIGWPGAGSDEVSSLVLDAGDTLLLYTDGLVEARKNILEGIDDLTVHAMHLVELPACDLPAALVTRILAGAQRRDDTLALVLRRTAAEPLPSLTRTLGPGAAETVRARRALTAWLAEIGKPSDDATVVAAELLANAARFARSTIIFSAMLEAGTLRICVVDDGPGDSQLSSRGVSAPPAHALAGRGLVLVRSLSEAVQFRSSAAGTTVTVTVPLDVDVPLQLEPDLIERF